MRLRVAIARKGDGSHYLVVVNKKQEKLLEDGSILGFNGRYTYAHVMIMRKAKHAMAEIIRRVKKGQGDTFSALPDDLIRKLTIDEYQDINQALMEAKVKYNKKTDKFIIPPTQ